MELDRDDDRNKNQSKILIKLEKIQEKPVNFPIIYEKTSVFLRNSFDIHQGNNEHFIRTIRKTHDSHKEIVKRDRRFAHRVETRDIFLRNMRFF